MQIIANQALVNLKNEEIKSEDGESFTVGKSLANTIINPKLWKGDKIKAFILSQKLYTEDVVEIDASDLSNIKKAVEANTDTSFLITGQILVILDGIKNAKKEEKNEGNKDKSK